MDSLISPGYVQAAKFGTGPDFSIFTGAMREIAVKELPPEDQDKPILRMPGSSVIEDLQGDTMQITALQDMTTIPQNLTFWLNHSYNLPDDAYGKLYGRPEIRVSNRIADLWIAAEAFLSNPAAARTYHLIKDEGARFGCSIGCMVTEWSFVNPDNPFESGILIDHVYTVEFSIVGVPANQRCWVENAIRGVFARSLVEGNADAARSLAPAMRGLFGKQYEDILRNMTSEGLRKDLERIPHRDGPPQKIIYVFDGVEGFALRDSKGMKKTLSRDEVSVFLEGHKAASGTTSFPLMDIGTQWSGSKAESQIFAWAHSDDDSIQASKARQCFLYYDPDNADKQSGYKLPFCYIDGSPKVVPLGVRAVAGVLSGARGGLSGVSDADISSIKGKVKTLYGRINSQFKPDPEWTVPWEKEDSVQSAEERIDQKKMPAASEVSIAPDGTHEACTGTHTHSHKAYGEQGSDEMHSHEHEHHGDADHGHAHEKSQDAEKHGEIFQTDTPQGVTDGDGVQHDALRGVYHALLDQANAIGRQLGLAPVGEEKHKAIMPVNIPPQEVISLISNVDTCVDALMQGFGIPDIDTPDDGEPETHYSLAGEVHKAFEDFFTAKEGREISEKNQRQLQVIHDVAKAMHPGVCQSDGTAHQGPDTDATQAESATNVESQMDAYVASIDRQAAILTKFGESLESLSVQSIVEAQVAKCFSEAHDAIKALRIEQQEVVGQLRKLKEMPMGRPTNFVGRTIVEEEGIATYQDFMHTTDQRMWSLEEALSATEIVTRDDGMRCRVWGDGIGGEVAPGGARPRLSESQKIYMRPMDVLRYNKGQKVLVPVIDE